jgi:hypothetical protein
MKKTISSIFLSLILTGLVLFGCLPPPNFPDTPKIKFLEIIDIDSQNIGIVIEFEDGDADMGLATTQINPPYQEYFYITIAGDTVPDPTGQIIADSIKNIHFSNAILATFVKRKGVFEKTHYGISFNGLDTIERPDLRFPPVTQKVQGQPVSGTIEIKISTKFFPWLPEDTLKFDLYVFDRALHKSNTVRTSPFNVNP